VAITIKSPFDASPKISGNENLFDISISLIAFGFIHWRYSYTVSFLYGFTKKILPFAMSILPDTTKILGITILSVGLVVLIVFLLKISG
jgi:hypothetical protein